MLYVDTPELPFPLLADIAEGRCIPFIGAGFSRNAVIANGTMPDWRDLGVTLASEGALDPSLAPPEVAQEYERRYGRVQLLEAVRRALHMDECRPGRSHMAFVNLPFDTVYTTNFDVLLETAYAAAGRPFRSLVGELQLPFHAGQTATSIVKMHGDLRHEEHIVLTKNDYDKFLEKYPVVATHLSAMLITRTPLFLGYSLTDPDFLSIRNVVRSRLGQFQRMSYVMQIGTSPEAAEGALQEGIHIIGINPAAQTVDEAIEVVLSAAQKRLDVMAGAKLRRSRPDVFEDSGKVLSETSGDLATATALQESTSTLCFVMMPFTEPYDRVYRELIVPAVEDVGLSPLRADEIPSAGFVMEQIRAAIQQSRLCIADVTYNNPNVLYEVGFAQATRKPVVLMASDISNLPFNIAAERVIRYGPELEKYRSLLRRAISHILTQDRFVEAEKLLASGSPRGAIAVAAVVLEHLLRELANKHNVPLRQPSGMMVVTRALKQAGVIDINLYAAIENANSARNNAVHSLEREPTTAEAQVVIDVAKRVATVQ